MNKVVTVNLAGRAWQLEEAAYDELAAYLDAASARLSGNPDREEIVADLEGAIADRCAEHLSEHKTVVTASDMTGIIQQMGPVVVDDTTQEHGYGGDADAPTQPLEPRPVKRLYRLPDDRILGGVCSGMAAYFNIDVTVMRVAWIILTVLTGGALIIAYLLMWIVVPEAATSDERAAARGITVSAQELISRARVAAPALQGVGAFFLTLVRGVAAIVFIAMTIAAILVLGAWVATLWSTIPDGRAFGFTFDADTDPWLLRVWLTSVAWIAIAPLAALALGARRLASKGAPGSRHTGAWFVGGTVLWVAALVSACMIAWTSSSDIRAAIDDGNGIVRFGDYEVCVDDGEWEAAEKRVICPNGDDIDIDRSRETADPAEPAEPADPAKPV